MTDRISVRADMHGTLHITAIDAFEQDLPSTYTIPVPADRAFGFVNLLEGIAEQGDVWPARQYGVFGNVRIASTPAGELALSNTRTCIIVGVGPAVAAFARQCREAYEAWAGPARSALQAQWPSYESIEEGTEEC